MSDERPNAVFNIGSQQGNISNVGRDMTVYGGQHSVVAPAEIVHELASLRAALAALDLDPAVRRSAAALLDDAERELDRPEPKAEKAAGPIERLTKLLKDAGAISAAGAALVDPIRSIASLLGGAGRTILRLIG